MPLTLPSGSPPMNAATPWLPPAVVAVWLPCPSLSRAERNSVKTAVGHARLTADLAHRETCAVLTRREKLVVAGEGGVVRVERVVSELAVVRKFIAMPARLPCRAPHYREQLQTFLQLHSQFESDAQSRIAPASLPDMISCVTMSLVNWAIQLWN